ncbi:MAG TPA: hypothetical protein VMX17_14670 [Candidatus Glassbacteria bacterium]|nr:hypothetical protein [Candidatus Glassbacteria bacterium]
MNINAENIALACRNNILQLIITFLISLFATTLGYGREWKIVKKILAIFVIFFLVNLIIFLLPYLLSFE